MNNVMVGDVVCYGDETWVVEKISASGKVITLESPMLPGVKVLSHPKWVWRAGPWRGMISGASWK